jgi:hypothetical protein
MQPPRNHYEEAIQKQKLLSETIEKLGFCMIILHDNFHQLPEVRELLETAMPWFIKNKIINKQPEYEDNVLDFCKAKRLREDKD